MALFTRRDRIAIACIAVLILSGWIVRYSIHRHVSPDQLRVIGNAVQLPEDLESGDKCSTGLIDINTADEKELELLPMIGPVRAADIVAYREKYGAFKTISDIKNVRGIGPVTFDKIKDRITVNSKYTTVKQERNTDK